ncbi:MAG: flagellar protein FlaG [Halomonas sp.]|nr:flagellar protein FlaG [Halomonas sp.]TVP50494.1 MAG: flagellar protein FlaG [Halomonas sp.]
MNSLPTDAATTALSSALPNLNPKQQLESTLNQLAVTGSQLAKETTDDRQITTSELVESVQQINDVMRTRGLEFELSEAASRVITRVIDKESGEVIREIPAEEVLKIAERLEEMQGQIISLEA